MSTKKLSRTVIEGGRRGYSKYNRRNSHGEERAAERDFCKKVLIDPEYAEEDDIKPKRKAYKEFADKLSPMQRWIESQVGRPWDEVRSEIFQKFDTRTTAGRHITFDHLLREIVETSSGFDSNGYIANPNVETLEGRKYRWFSRKDYYVNEDGILCKPDLDYDKYIRQRYRNLVSKQQQTEVSEWLRGRMISEQGGKYFWHVPTTGIWLATWHDPKKIEDPYDSHAYGKLRYYLLDNGLHEIHGGIQLSSGWYLTPHNVHSDFWNEVENPFSFRQRGELNQEEATYFRKLPERLRLDILSFSKGRI